MKIKPKFRLYETKNSMSMGVVGYSKVRKKPRYKKELVANLYFDLVLSQNQEWARRPEASGKLEITGVPVRLLKGMRIGQIYELEVKALT